MLHRPRRVWLARAWPPALGRALRRLVAILIGRQPPPAAAPAVADEVPPSLPADGGATRFAVPLPSALHGGVISLTSELGRGTIVTIVMPVTRNSAAELPARII
jgi:hypothetical protein